MTLLRSLITVGLLAFAVSHARAQDVAHLQFFAQEPLYLDQQHLTEPSGLDVQQNFGRFWTVSDGFAGLYSLIAPSARIDAIHHLPYQGLEGVSVGWTDGVHLMVQEETNSIIYYNSKNPESTAKLPLSKMDGYEQIAGYFDGPETNKGLEGIAVDRGGHRVFVVKEAQPRLLIEISSDLDKIVGHKKLKSKHGFHVRGLKDHKLDISGLYYDSHRDALWMASDRGACIFLYDLKTNEALRLEIHFDGDNAPDLEGIEGITMSASGEFLYLVSDAGRASSLFTFRVIY